MYYYDEFFINLENRTRDFVQLVWILSVSTVLEGVRSAGPVEGVSPKPGLPGRTGYLWY